MSSVFGIQVVMALTAFLIVYFVEKPLIPLLTRLKVGNTEREELKSHQVKNGTPSMGGLGILAGLIVAAVVYMLVPLIMKQEVDTELPVLVGFVVLYGLTGFADDYLKTVKKSSDGLKAWQKMGLLIVITVALMVYINIKDPTLITDVRLPFISEKLHLGWVGYVVFFLAVLGTINGVNFTDGVDGLVSTVTIPVAAFFGFCGLDQGVNIAPLSFALIGALMGFLMHNAYPAKIFMGDTGSLALGGYVVISAYLTGTIVFVLIVGLIYWVEILSVMIQVTYFKLTHGKRVFRMAPIHHHFELGGMSETQVVTAFTIVTVILMIIGLWGYMG